MSIKTKDIMECYGCGLFLSKPNNKNKKIFKCPRCNSKLLLDKEHNFNSLYFAISSVLLFILLNIYPIISLNVNGVSLNATLWGTVRILFEQNFFVVASIVFFTIILAPLLNSLVIIFSFLQIHTSFRFFTQTLLHDAFHFFRRWGFIDVFIVSIIVTYIKLVGMVSSTKFDLGFYAMLVYIFCFYMSNVKFEGRNVFGE